ncbi:hypothetical protein GIB67_021834 [Kingdonia uniflora]|uniref:U4/U6.U5 tri-snRNP-associated protein 2 n=1 Tax=Kingdonia uniflora TaxID=39325 RepID=A0A7J7P7C5_9MAGN|nr:hypothetical protein GIB67_021834 [Kingdonia uniflora]
MKTKREEHSEAKLKRQKLFHDHSPLDRRSRRLVEIRSECPYLDTVNPQVLQVLQESHLDKFCLVSLSNLNVYACLVCGNYYQGRDMNSHAYTHSLEANHYVYINVKTHKLYCLPDGYEINDPSLDDVRHVLNSRCNENQAQQLDKNKQWSRAPDGSDYLPGLVVSLDISNNTDFVNATIQSLMRVTPLRDFFLTPENYQNCRSLLVNRFGELTQKIWHARNFNGQVSPHEFLLAISERKFQIGVQSDPIYFMSWLLNKLHTDLGGSKGSIIYKCFQGELEAVKEIPNKSSTEKENGGDVDGATERDNVFTETSRMRFLMLGLDLPSPPSSKNVVGNSIIPEVSIYNMLKKFDGESITKVVRPTMARIRYRVTKLPPYLILHMRRFTKNGLFIEKNPTLVDFPVKNLQLKKCIPLPAMKENEKYDLIANILHDGKPGEGCYRVFVEQKLEELWYEMQDWHVAQTAFQLVAPSESYMQIYEQKQ